MGNVKVYTNKENKTEIIIRKALVTIISLMIYAMVLLMASSIFQGMYVENFLYAFIAAGILVLLNTTIKPFLVLLTLPITIVSLGLLYPIVNVVILKLCALIMGGHLDIVGFIVPFFIAIFISFMKMLLDAIVLPVIKGDL